MSEHERRVDRSVEEVEVEVVDGELMGAGQPLPARTRLSALPAIRASAVAATGFVAGATAMALLKRRTPARRSPSLPAVRVLGGSAESSRTYLVTVRLIASSGR